MSPEYKVEIVVPYGYVVDAADVGDAEKNAWQMFEDDLDDYGHPAVIESIDEIKEQSKAEPCQTVGQSDLGEIQGLICVCQPGMAHFDTREWPTLGMPAWHVRT